MTQAFNLSQFANKVNTSGQADLTTAVTGTFGFSSGGTNATSYTTGTLLTSNGTAIVSLANTGTAGTYGNAAYHPVITTDAYGRVSSVTNTAISISASAITTGTLTGDLTVTGNLTANTVTINNGILVNNTTVGLNQTISTAFNGLSVGPMTLSTGVSVTVASGQRWYIL